MVQCSFRLPNADYLGFPATTEAILQTALKAEEAGFDALFVNDHVIVDDSPRSEPWRNVYDPLMTLAYVAARTTQIRLGTSVLIMPYRNPVVTAKMVATLDQLSDGRAIVGVGAGWNEAEYAALDVPHHERGARTNEYLRLWKACWEPDPVTFNGRFFSFDGLYTSPKPVQQPHPPIWIGGSSHASLRRAARFGQVWQPTPTPLPTLVNNWQYPNDVSAEIGREEPPRVRMSFWVIVSSITGVSASGSDRPPGLGTPEQIASDMNRYRQEAGLEEFQLNCHECGSLQQLLDTIDVLTQEILPKVED